MNIAPETLISWMNTIRNYSNTQYQYTILENFWESQIKSKLWLTTTLKNCISSTPENIFIFGGWFGVLGTLLCENFNMKEIYSIDKDPMCEVIGEKLNPKVKFLTSKMEEFIYPSVPFVVINTSIEHMTQDIYTQWYENIPSGTLVALQGNNFYECKGHIRCSNSITEFKIKNPLTNYLFEGELDCTQFTRFMTIGYKE